jgi:hypothetical protein
MTKLVKSLRSSAEGARQQGRDPWAKIFNEAADEIETLRSAMRLASSALALLEKNGAKPGWGVAKDLLHSAMKIAGKENIK